jgi:hypothetical protein
MSVEGTGHRVSLTQWDSTEDGVYGAFEASQRVDYGGIEQRAYLGRVHPDDASGRVDPIERIEHPHPGEAAGESTLRSAAPVN